MHLGRFVVSITLVTAAFAVSLPRAAWAQTFTWINESPGTQNWHEPTNWSPAQVPPAGADVVLPAGANTVEIVSADVSLHSLSVGRTLAVRLNRSLSPGTTLLASTISLAPYSTLEGGVLDVAGGRLSTLPPSECSDTPRLSDIVINGDLTFTNSLMVRWNRVTLNGTMTFTVATNRLWFEGDQTLTGRFVNTSTGRLYFLNASAGTLTVAQGASIEGGLVTFRGAANPPCSGSGLLSVVNLGTIAGNTTRSTIVESPISFGSTGVMTGPVEFWNVVDLQGGSWTHSSGAMRLANSATLQNGTLIPMGGAIENAAAAGCSGAPRFSNLTIGGDLTFTTLNHLRWNNVAIEGTLTFTGTGLYSTRYVYFEGDQTITGNLRGAKLYSLTDGTVTIAEGASVGGTIDEPTSVCPTLGHMTLVNRGTLVDSRVFAPTFFGPGASISGTVTFVNTLDLQGGTFVHDQGSIVLGGQEGYFFPNVLQNGELVFAGGGLRVRDQSSCSPATRFTNIRLLGDVTLSSASNFIWKNVALDGTMTFANTSSNYIWLDGDQLLTGHIVNSSSGSLTLQNAGDGTLTIGPGASVEGGNIYFNHDAQFPCSANGFLHLINMGTINGNIAGRRINIYSPNINLGAVIGNVLNLNATPLPAYDVATPTQSAGVYADRNDPGESSTEQFAFMNLVLEAGRYFGLGPAESLTLNAGTGNLVVRQGATFSGKGLIFCQVINQGLLRLPTNRLLTINTVTGGVTTIASDLAPGLPVSISIDQLLQTNRESLLVFQGSARGGDGSFAGGGGHWSLESPAVVLRGTTTWDGVLDVSGTLEQTESGVLRLFVAGNAPGDEHSLLHIGDSASIGGTIQIIIDPLLFGNTPSVGQSFDLIVADGGITASPGLVVQTLMTAEGAAAMGLDIDPFETSFGMDPDAFVVFPASLFDVALASDGTTLRFTMTLPICAPQPIATTEPACSRDIAEFRVANPGSAPLAYQWQYEDGIGTETWSNLEAGFDDRFGTVLTPAERTMAIRRPRASANGTRFRCVVTNPCDTVTTSPVALAVLDSAAEPCGGCSICDADFDQNGGVDGGDVAAFIAAFEEGSPCADVDRDGGVGGGDLAYFISQFETGSCD